MNQKYGLGVSTNLHSIENINVEDTQIKIDNPSNVQIESFTKKVTENNHLDKHHNLNSKALKITIPENKIATIKIEKNYIDNSSNHLEIIAKKNSTIKITQIINSKNTVLSTETVHITAENNSNIKFIEINTANNNHYTNKTIDAKENSQIEWLIADINPKHTISSTISDLNGKNAKSVIKHIYKTKDNQRIDLLTKSVHSNESTYSDIKVKGIIDGGEALSRGNVTINKNAQDSQGYEKSDTIILKDGRAISIPDLEIHNEKVMCSHGSTITRVSDDQIFYLKTRGFIDAQKELVRAFLSELIEDLEDKELILEA